MKKKLKYVTLGELNVHCKQTKFDCFNCFYYEQCQAFPEDLIGLNKTIDLKTKGD